MKYLVVSDNHSDREILVDLKMNSKIKSICSFIVGIPNFLKRILYGNIPSRLWQLRLRWWFSE